MLRPRDIFILFSVGVLFLSSVTGDDDDEVQIRNRVQGLAPLDAAAKNAKVPGRYIVVFKPKLGKQRVKNDKATIQRDSKVRFYNEDCVDLDDNEVCEVRGSANQMRKLRKNKDVNYVEEVQRYTVVQKMCQCPCPSTTTLLPTASTAAPNKTACSKYSNTASWGLDRIDSKQLKPDKTMNIPASGSAPVDVYVIDTGVYVNHADFNGRAIWGTNTVDSDNTDGHGHGTHVAGTAAGGRYGIAKNARIIAVKVLNARGGGSTTSVIKGINWAAANSKKTKRPSVANLSLGGGKSTAINAAIKQLFRAGVTVVVAAGNSNRDACNYSPASAKQAITVACSTSSDGMCSFSNYGKCVDVIAPGYGITSAWIGSSQASKTISGTSMSAPHVAGVAAAYLSNKPSTKPKNINQWINRNSAKNVIKLDKSKNTKNRLLYYGC